MKKIKFVLLIGVLTLNVMSASGCFVLLAGAAGAGGVAYVQGVLEKNVDSPVSRAHSATLMTLEKMEMTVTSEEKGPNASKFKAQTSDGKAVAVDIDALTERSSKIRIRVGLFGDKDISQLILNGIEKRL